MILGILTLLFALMAFLPGSSPIKAGAAGTAVRASAEEDVEDITTAFMQAITTYDYRKVNDTIRRSEEFTTDGFAQHYQSALRGDINVFRQRILDNRAIATGEVKGVAVQSIDDDTATLLTFAVQTVRTRREPRETSKFLVIEAALVRDGSDWKVDSLRVPAGVGGQAAG
ncbi:MAG: hypothetical protein ACRDKJ_12265 [Actinomycetota bacterium]